MTGEKEFAGYTAAMVHSEKSIRLYAAKQYDLFRKRQKYLTVLVSFFLIAAGILAGANTWRGALLLLIGCVAVTNLYAASNHIANTVIRQFRGRFPTIRYDFYSDRMDVSTAPVPVYYQSITLLADDKSYLYLFLTPQTGYMIDKGSVAGGGGYNELANMLEQVSGRRIIHTSGVGVNGFIAFIKDVRRKRKNS